MKQLRKNINIFILFIALLYSSSFIFWSYYKDPFYWFDIADHYDSFMTCFYLWIGNLWKSTIGSTLLSYRLLGWLISILSYSLPYVILLSKSERTRYFWWYIAGLLFLGHGTQGMFNPDSMTLLFHVVITLLLLRKRYTNFADIVLLALLSGLSISSRFPNIVILPIVSFFVIIDTVFQKTESIWNAFLHVILYLGMSSTITIVVTCIFCNDYNYLRLLLEAFSQEQISNSQHSGLVQFLGYYVSTFTQSMKVGLPIVGIVAILFIIGNKAKNVFFYLISFLSIFCIALKGDVVFNEILGWKVVYSIFVISLLIYWCKNDKVKMTRVLLIVMIGLANTAGSDTGLMKMHPYISAFAPFAFIFIQPKTWNYPLARVTMCSLLLFSFVFFNVHYFFEPIVATPFNNARVKRQFYEGTKCYQFLTLDQISFLKTNKRLIEDLGPVEHVIINGEPSILLYSDMEVETPSWLPFYVSQFNSTVVNHIVNNMNQDPNGYVIDYLKCPLLEQEMLKNGFVGEYLDFANVYKNK